MSKMMAGPIADPRPTLSSSIEASLRQSILRGDLQPGSKLQVDVLREQFSVSLSPVREALSRLASAGLVTSEDQRGYWVTAVSMQNLSEVINLRMEFETFALRQSLTNGGDEFRQVVMTAMDRLIMHSKISGGDRRDEEWEVLHRQFHLTLLSGSHMPMLIDFVSNLHDISDRYRRIFLKKNPADRNVGQEHQRIFDAVREGEIDIACALLRQHIQRTGSAVLSALLVSDVK